MNEQPASIDAILASIRARVTGSEAAPEPVQPPPEPDIMPLAAITLPPDVTAMTLDTLIRQMLGPHIKAWLDAHMPEIVEKIAREEIRRMTGKL
ncbi:DUF2497 domain-containing protein [Sandarakinorhabdus sp.]|uniref:DUF2497 domain-containing protein n=1 Tax=Sandarakinorhabdus sp. TaxID=1916663 RepID=UPI003340DE29